MLHHQGRIKLSGGSVPNVNAPPSGARIVIGGVQKFPEIFIFLYFAKFL
jgi:hypothetical protein